MTEVARWWVEPDELDTTPLATPLEAPLEDEEPDPFAELKKFLVAPEEWMQRARCRELNVPTSAFFPNRGQSQKLAKQTCDQCVVQFECAEYANRSHSLYGIWGGVIRRRGDASTNDDDMP